MIVLGDENDQRISWEKNETIKKKKGLSQEALANECELDRTYIASVENGKRNISIVNLEKISKALKVSLSDFFDLSEVV